MGWFSCLEESGGTDLMSPASSLLLCVGLAPRRLGVVVERESPRKKELASYQGKKIVGWKESLLI